MPSTRAPRSEEGTRRCNSRVVLITLLGLITVSFPGVFTEIWREIWRGARLLILRAWTTVLRPLLLGYTFQSLTRYKGDRFRSWLRPSVPISKGLYTHRGNRPHISADETGLAVTDTNRERSPRFWIRAVQMDQRSRARLATDALCYVPNQVGFVA